MKTIKQTDNAHNWPRQRVETISCRKQDFIIRIADWSKDEDEPAYDVEVYIGGVYDWDQSKSCTKFEYGTMHKAKQAAILFAQEQTLKLL